MNTLAVPRPSVIDRCFSLLANGTQALTGPRLTVLIFHRVLEQPDPLNPGTPGAAQFHTLMTAIRDGNRVLPLDESLERLAMDSLPARSVAITFDDGYADNRTIAMPILQALGLTATFFVAPGYLNGGLMFNDRVIESVRRWRGEVMDLAALGLGVHPIGSELERLRAAEQLIGHLKYLPLERRTELSEAIAEEGNCSLPSDVMMTDAQVRELADGGMSIGAHTMTHPILARVAPDAAQREIADSRSVLEALIGDKVRLFAYPNGKPTKDYTQAHVDMVRRVGFAGAVSTAMGVASHGADLLQVPRFTPWRWDALGFRLQLLQNLLRNRYPLAAL